jgi:hypothetical protein
MQVLAFPKRSFTVGCQAERERQADDHGGDTGNDRAGVSEDRAQCLTEHWADAASKLYAMQVRQAVRHQTADGHNNAFSQKGNSRVFRARLGAEMQHFAEVRG